MLESQSDWLPGFDKRFAELTHYMVKDLEKCLQCGKCTGQCPAAKLSSYNPRKMIRDITIGNVERVISSHELWLCFFCGGCYSVCPRDINFPFAVLMLRCAALTQDYGWSEVKKLKEPYVQDYYNTGLSVSLKERNKGVRKQIARNSNTDGRIETIRKRMGLTPRRIVSEKALSEIKFIADTTGMTDLMKEIDGKQSREKKWNYGSPADLVRIKRGPNQKFMDLVEDIGKDDSGEGPNDAT